MSEKIIILKSSEWDAWIKFMVRQTVKGPEGKELVRIMGKVGEQLDESFQMRRKELFYGGEK